MLTFILITNIRKYFSEILQTIPAQARTHAQTLAHAHTQARAQTCAHLRAQARAHAQIHDNDDSYKLIFKLMI